MTFPARPSGTRSETQPPHALIQAACRTMTHRDGVNYINRLYPELSRSWAKRNFTRMMQMSSINMATYIATALEIFNNTDIITAVMQRHDVSRDTAIGMLASADMAGRYARQVVRGAALHPSLRDDTAITAIARLDMTEVAA